MSFLSNVTALFIFAVAAAPFAGCSSGSQDACASFCKGTVSCVDPSSCVPTDPSALETSCATACQSGFDALSADESSAFTACLDCIGAQLSGGQCDLGKATSSCAASCAGASAQAAEAKWGKVFAAAPAGAGATCTNGKNLSGGSCSSGGSGTGAGATCTTACCNSSNCGSSPGVSASCTTQTSGAASCTCTEGKNKGKTFTSPGSAGDACAGFDPWTECNL